MTVTITIDGLMRTAADLMSEDAENPEYDRALVELVCDLLPGVSTDDRETVERLLRAHREGRTLCTCGGALFGGRCGDCGRRA